MKTFIVGSMLSPFCVHNSNNKFWVMFCGIQFVIDKTEKKMYFSTISFKQWTHKLFRK